MTEATAPAALEHRDMLGKLTTHALDLVLGRGAQGLSVYVRRLPLGEPQLAVLDGGGRGLLMEGKSLEEGVYELTFMVGDYHRATGLVQGSAFLEEVPIRFRVAEPKSHYHIPLLISLYGYSTYRGG